MCCFLHMSFLSSPHQRMRLLWARYHNTCVITHSVALCTCMAWCHSKDMSSWNILSKYPSIFFSPCRGWSNFLCADHSNTCTNTWPRGGTGTDCCQSQRQFASLSVSAGDSSSPVWPAAIVITNGKSKQKKKIALHFHRKMRKWTLRRSSHQPEAGKND